MSSKDDFRVDLSRDDNTAVEPQDEHPYLQRLDERVAILSVEQPDLREGLQIVRVQIRDEIIQVTEVSKEKEMDWKIKQRLLKSIDDSKILHGAKMAIKGMRKARTYADTPAGTMPVFMER